ncbi:hypothetical protein C0991_008165 [Blastosporella zonata]|nr:hypothetical protein C0991_008165 [Blastosporella zonata]
MAISTAKRAFLLYTATIFLQAAGFDNSRSDNLAVYYGQNSGGATHSSSAYSQKALSTYCQDDTIDAIPLAFLDVFFSEGGLPEINLANACNSDNGNVFPGTMLAMCPDLADDIRACQARGKILTISLGGATGSSSISSNAQGRAFAETVWNLFLGGSSDTRPFGDAVLDGVDLDIENGNGSGLAAFITQLRELSQGGNKRYYVTAAPQCPFPDAYLGNVISAVGFDAIYVQCKWLILLRKVHILIPSSYNNYCGVNNFDNPYAWNFGVWDNWAKNTSPNKDVKVYIGAPASSSAAGVGYVPAATLAEIAQDTRSQYSSFGGIMLWDASQAYGNGRYDVAVKEALIGESPPITSTQTTSTTTTEETSTTSTTETPTSTTTDEIPTTTSTTSTTTPTTASTTASMTTLEPTSTPVLCILGIGLNCPSTTTSSGPDSTSDAPAPTSGAGAGADGCDGTQVWSSTTSVWTLFYHWFLFISDVFPSTLATIMLFMSTSIVRYGRLEY